MFKKTRKILKDIFSMRSEIQVKGASQPHVLAVRMNQAHLQHDETALVDINNVRVIKGQLDEDEPSDTTTLFFCPVQELIVKKRILPGDGEYINTHTSVKLEDIKAPKPVFRKQSGLYNLTDVIICANGKITITATSKTKWVKV